MAEEVLCDLVWKNSSDNLFLEPIILECRSILQDFTECRAEQIFSEVNHAADCLIKTEREQLTIDLGYTFLDEPPIGLQDILVEDCTGVYYPRTMGPSAPMASGYDYAAS